jgi:NADH-quinone oxidoreductase subunit I
MSGIYGTGILKSMRIAFRNFFRPPITVQYPHEKVQLPERSRWAVRMKYDEDGQHKCTACIACERACPDFVIKIDVTTGEERRKHIDAWRYELGACMMCGLCVEACPFDAILMSHEYELAVTDPDALVEYLLFDVPAVGPKRRAAEPATAASTEPAPSSAPQPPVQGGEDD